MTEKGMQNTHEKSQLGWVKNSKLFHKRDASISNLTKWKKYQNLTKNCKKLQKAKANKYIQKYFRFSLQSL